MNKPIFAACLLMLSLWAASAEAKLVGDYRSQYVSSGQKACLAAMDHAHASTERAKLDAFCLCKMNYIADRVTEAQLDANHKPVHSGGPPQAVSVSASLARLINAGSAYCATR